MAAADAAPSVPFPGKKSLHLQLHDVNTYRTVLTSWSYRCFLSLPGERLCAVYGNIKGAACEPRVERISEHFNCTEAKTFASPFSGLRSSAVTSTSRSAYPFRSPVSRRTRSRTLLMASKATRFPTMSLQSALLDEIRLDANSSTSF